MKTILIFCRSYLSGGYGGTYQIRHCVKVLSSMGYQVLVVTGSQKADFADALGKVENEDIYIEDAFFERHPLTYLKPACLFKMFQSTQKIIRLIHYYNPNLIMVYGDRPYNIYLKFQRFAPVVFCRQDAILACPSGSRFLPNSHKICSQKTGFRCLCTDKREGCLGELSFIHKIGRVILRLFDLYQIKKFKYFLANSNYIRKVHQLNEGYIIYPTLCHESKVNFLEERNLFKVLFVGRLSQTKGVEDALRIFKKLPSQYHLTIIGNGPLLKSLREFCIDNNLLERVNFRGWLVFEDVYKEMQESGVTIVPSLWDEAFGMVGVESMSCGTPVVAYDVGGISEWCQAPYGITVACGDYEQAARAIVQLTSNREAWIKLSQQCVQYARQHFGQDVFKQRLEKFLNSFNLDLDSVNTL